jgi:hypothetical protein
VSATRGIAATSATRSVRPEACRTDSADCLCVASPSVRRRTRELNRASSRGLKHLGACGRRFHASDMRVGSCALRRVCWRSVRQVLSSSSSARRVLSRPALLPEEASGFARTFVARRDALGGCGSSSRRRPSAEWMRAARAPDRRPPKRRASPSPQHDWHTSERTHARCPRARADH